MSARPLPSLVLACEQPMTGYHETNSSLAYRSHISWHSPDSPVPVEVYPSLAFDMLVENRGSLRNLSMLDRVKDRAEVLTRQISSSDNLRWMNTWAACGEMETRVEALRKSLEKAQDTRRKGRIVLSSPWNSRPTECLRTSAPRTCQGA